MREAAALRRQDPVVGVLGRILGHADPEGGPLFHALENEINSVGALLAHSAQPGQDIILFTDTFFGPLDRDVVVGGKGFHPVLVVIGTLSDQLLAQDGNSEHLAKEMNHLLGPRQSAQIAVDDDPVEAVVDKEQKLTKELLEQFHGELESTAKLEDNVNPKKIKSGPGKQWMKGKDFRLAKEIKYIQRQAVEHDGRFVTIGPLVFFSTETGDAWMLDPSCQLAARLARDGDPEPIDFEETDTNYAIGWKGNYRIEGRAFVYIDQRSGRIITILGYPTAEIARLG